MPLYSNDNVRAAAARFRRDTFAGGAGPFTLTSAPLGVADVFFDGVLQPASAYSIASRSLTLAPGVDGASIESIAVRYAY